MLSMSVSVFKPELPFLETSIIQILPPERWEWDANAERRMDRGSYGMIALDEGRTAYRFAYRDWKSDGAPTVQQLEPFALPRRYMKWAAEDVAPTVSSARECLVTCAARGESFGMDRGCRGNPFPFCRGVTANICRMSWVLSNIPKGQDSDVSGGAT